MSRSFPHPVAADVELPQVLSALSDPVRLAMVRLLASGTAVNGGDLAPHLAKSTVAHHARVLREAGVTFTRPEGRVCWISLRRDLLDERFPGLLDIVLRSVEES